MPRQYHPDIDCPDLDRLADQADHARQERKDRQLEEAWEESERKRATAPAGWIPITKKRPPLTEETPETNGFFLLLRHNPHRDAAGQYRMHLWFGSTPIDATHWCPIPPFPPPRTFRAGDTVHHAPSGEDWVLATDEANGRVSPSGWPETMADAKDCRLLDPATDENRIAMLTVWAATGKGHEHEQDHRTRTARRQLEAEKSTQKAPPAPDQG